jgi:hypothetical protein
MDSQAGWDIAFGQDGALTLCDAQEFGNLDEFIVLVVSDFVLKEEVYIVAEILHGAVLPIFSKEIRSGEFLHDETPLLYPYCSIPVLRMAYLNICLLPLQSLDPQIDSEWSSTRIQSLFESAWQHADIARESVLLETEDCSLPCDEFTLLNLEPEIA